MYPQFVLLKDLPKDQLEDILAQNDLYSKLDPYDIKILPRANPENFVNICNFVDYYQLIPYREFIENIRYHILITTPEIIDNINQLPVNMIQKIYDHECIPNIKCRYHHSYDCDIKHICCYNFFSHNKRLPYNIDDASAYGHLEVVKYLFEVKHKDCTQYAIIWASVNNHLEIVKYLIEVQNQKYNQQTINGASKQVLAYLLTKPDSFI